MGFRRFAFRGPNLEFVADRAIVTITAMARVTLHPDVHFTPTLRPTEQK
jgi:hypothetical protein